MITREFNLYLHAGHSIPLVINVNQYDQGEQWLFTLFNADGTQYVPSSGAIVGIKSDNLGIINSGTVDSQGRVVINETQQMTAAVGKAVFELLIDSQTHGTANFVVLVEEKPGNNADMSESDLSLLQEAIDATSPLPTGGTVGQVLTKTANGSAWSDAGTPTQAQVAEAVADWADENITVTTGVVIDQSLSVQGAAADAKKTGDEISALKSQINAIIEGGGGFRDEAKQTLLAFLSIVASSVENGQDYYDAFANALLNKQVLSLNAVFTQEGLIYTNDQLDDLKQYLTVTAYYDDGTSGEITTYTLTGTLEEGTSTITVTYGTVSTTFDVVVTATILPYGYHRVEYIESDGNQEINFVLAKPTGSSAKVVVEYYKESKPTDKSRDILCTTGSSGFLYEMGFSSASDHVIYTYSTESIYINDEIVYGNRNVWEATFTTASPYTNVVLTHGSEALTNQGTKAVKSQLFSSAWEVHLFGYDDGGTTRTRVSGRIYDIAIYDGSTLKFHGIPCYRVSDGEIGIYSLTSDTFYTNIGTGTLTKGADI